MRSQSRGFALAHTERAVVAIRVVSSLAWLQSALVGADAKWSPAFLSGAGLTQRITGTFVHTALAPWIARALQSVVVPHAQLFAVLLAVCDLAIGISLFLGLFTRLGAALEILRCLVNVAIAGGAGADTIGFNVMLATAGAIALATGAGRRAGIDAFLLRSRPRARGLRLFA